LPLATISTLSMDGVCMGKMRSTPTPSDTLRTVKVLSVVPRFTRRTTPWKTWMRSLSPSMMRVWTLTVSPARNSGMSIRMCSRSICFMMSICRLLF